MKKILITNIYTPYNLGDRAILEGVENIVRTESNEEVVFYYATRFMKELSEFRSNVVSDFFNQRSTDSLLVFVKKALCLFSAKYREKYLLKSGMTFYHEFTDFYVIGGNFLYSSPRIVSRTMIFHCLNIWFYSKLGNVVVMPQTLGPFNSIVDKFFVKAALSQARKVYVRDKVSLTYYKKSVFLPDAAFFLIDEISFNGSVRKNISFVVADYKWSKYAGESEVQENFENYINSMAVAINELGALGWQIDIVAQVNVEACVDATVFEKLRNLVNAKVKYIDISGYSINDAINYYKSRYFVVGTRMHSVILALVAGCSTLNLYYQPKGRDLYAWMELEDFAIDVDYVKSQNLLQVILKMETKEFKQKLERAQELLAKNKNNWKEGRN